EVAGREAVERGRAIATRVSEASVENSANSRIRKWRSSRSAAAANAACELRIPLRPTSVQEPPGVCAATPNFRIMEFDIGGSSRRVHRTLGADLPSHRAARALTLP